MKIYHYSPETCFYLGSSEADESPLEPGVYLLPAHATFVKPPPEVEKNKQIVWSNSKWEIQDIAQPPKIKYPSPTWDDIRNQRNSLLSYSDWSQLPDAPLTEEERAVWKSYRQRLRDLPETFPDPTQVIWPEQPTKSDK